MSIKKELVPKSSPMLVQCVHYGNIAKHILNRKVLVRKFQGDYIFLLFVVSGLLDFEIAILFL